MASRTLLTAILAVSLAFIISVGGTAAYSFTVSEAANTVTTSNVHGKIIQDATPAYRIYPGTTVQKVVNVKNTGEANMLVRVNLEKTWSDASLNPDNIQLNLNDGGSDMWWDGGDGYFYYKGVLAPGEVTRQPLLNSYTLTAATGNNYEGHEAQIDVNMECVQAYDNAVSTWGKTYADLGIADPTPPQDTSAFENLIVVYRGTGEIMQRSAGSDLGDLFTNFKGLVPGDVRIQNIALTNGTSQAAELFLRAEVTGQDAASFTPQQLDLINNLLTRYITITVLDQRGEKIYQGALDGAHSSAAIDHNGMMYDISLGNVIAGGQTSLSVELSIDPSLGNEYEDLAANVNWLITARYTDQIVPPPSPSPGEPGQGPGFDPGVYPLFPPPVPQTSPAPEPMATVPVFTEPPINAGLPQETAQPQTAGQQDESALTVLINPDTLDQGQNGQGGSVAGSGGRANPKTGDTNMLTLMEYMMGTSFAALVALVILYTRGKKRARSARNRC